MAELAPAASAAPEAGQDPVKTAAADEAVDECRTACYSIPRA
jgi:hypothetical protein